MKKSRPAKKGFTPFKENSRSKPSSDRRPKRDGEEKGSFKSYRENDRSEKPKRNFEDGGQGRFRKDSDAPKRTGGTDRFGNDRPKSRFSKDEDRPKRSFGDDKPKGRFSKDEDRPKRSFSKDDDRPKRSFGDDKPKGRFSKDDERPKRSFSKDDDRPKRSFGDDKPKGRFSKDDDRPKRSFSKDEDKPKRSFGDDKPKGRFSKDEDRPKRSFSKDEDRPKRNFSKDEDRPKRTFSKEDGESRSKRTFGDGESSPKRTPRNAAPEKEKSTRKRVALENNAANEEGGNEMPLNKYISHCGICSRRKAVDFIKEGLVTVNGQKIEEPAFKVTAKDVVTLKDKRIFIQKNLVYVLLNKPKGYITTTDDPEGRQTVMELVTDAAEERLFPVGRLDRNTSGLLLLTNDGELAQKLAHPKHNIKKIYHVELDKPLTRADFDQIIAGVTLEDGLALVDALAYVDTKDKKQIGIEIHSGKNRIVRRIFEHLGYQVEKLDRVMYAGLTKKNVNRGKWRFLSEKEVILLKHFK